MMGAPGGVPLARQHAGALAWLTRMVLILAGFSPLIVWLGLELPGIGGVAGVIDAWFAFHCHREPARSLELFGRVLPVCARCFGIYSGLGLGALMLRPRLAAWPLRIWLGVAILLMLLDVMTEMLGWRAPWSAARFATGVLLAYPVGASLVWAARGE